MTATVGFFRDALVSVCLLLMVSCSATDAGKDLVLVGSTPGDEPIKTMLSIPLRANVDFIRWTLQLHSKNSFELKIAYGESQPNTLGFKERQEKVIKGTHSNSQDARFQIYRLTGSGGEKLSLAKISENLFHILTINDELMIGNGGWSYSLNRQDPIEPGNILASSLIPNDNPPSMAFLGRTPCQELAGQHSEMNVSSSCFKLKWKLVLNSDPATGLPTTCSIRGVIDNEPHDLSGTWEVSKSAVSGQPLLIYKISVPEFSEPILLLVADGNVLFFVDKNFKLLTGNKDFSFTLNRWPV